jgi:hypothetical protein
MEAIIIGIAVDIGLGLLFLIGKKIFLSIRDYYRHSNGIFLKNSTEKDAPTVDKKEIDDEVQRPSKAWFRLWLNASRSK